MTQTYRYISTVVWNDAQVRNCQQLIQNWGIRIDKVIKTIFSCLTFEAVSCYFMVRCEAMINYGYVKPTANMWNNTWQMKVKPTAKMWNSMWSIPLTCEITVDMWSLQVQCRITAVYVLSACNMWYGTCYLKHTGNMKYRVTVFIKPTGKTWNNSRYVIWNLQVACEITVHVKYMWKFLRCE